MNKSTFALFAACTLAGVASAQTQSGYATPQEKFLAISGGKSVYTPQVPPSPQFVGGSDSCTTPDAIAGQGSFAVNNTGATTGAPIGSCGIMAIDVWFAWTPSATGNATIQTCATIGGGDSVLAVWADAGPGNCPATQLACNDDSCGLSSSVTLAVTSGTTYLIELGSYQYTAGATPYSGTFGIAVNPPPVTPPNDDCSTPIVLPAGDQFVSFDTTLATTGTQGQTELACQDYSTTTMQKDIWYTWTSTQAGTVTVTTCGLMTGPTANADTRIGIYNGAGCPGTPAIACNDDQGHMGPGAGSGTLTCTAGGFNSTVTFTAVCGNSYTIQMAGWAATNNVGQFQITQSGVPCSPPAVGYCFGDDTGTQCPCSTNPPTSGTVPPGAAGNGCPNSLFPAGANLTSSGASSIGTDTLVLSGSSMPNSSALYFQGTAPQNGGLGNVFGDGIRCAGGAVTRLGTKVNGASPFAANSSFYPQGADLSVSVKGGVTSPGNRYYQCWYRNSALFCIANSTFNLTNGLNVTWVP